MSMLEIVIVLLVILDAFLVWALCFSSKKADEAATKAWHKYRKKKEEDD